MSATPPEPGDGPAPPELLAGIELFNRREFFACHEVLEELWKREPGTVRALYQGILQVGVAFYHLRRGNYRGAVKLLETGIPRLLPFQPACLGIDVAALVEAARWCQQRLLDLGEGRAAEFDPALIPTIRLVGRG